MIQSIGLKGIAVSILSKLPTWPPSLILVKVLNKALRQLIDDQSLSALSDKTIVIHVEDVGVKLYFTLSNSRFVPIIKPEQADLTISSTLSDFYRLAIRQEDPDTLFFNRRLLIEGNTELGLIAKNTIDSMEIPKSLLALSNLLKAIDALDNRSQNTKSTF